MLRFNVAAFEKGSYVNKCKVDVSWQIFVTVFCVHLQIVKCVCTLWLMHTDQVTFASGGFETLSTFSSSIQIHKCMHAFTVRPSGNM